MVWWKNPCFICLCVWEFFIQKKTSITLQLHAFVLPKPYADLLDTNLTHMCLVVALSFIKLWDHSEMSFILVWSRSCALHQMNFYTGSQLCHSIHPQNKTPMISLSSIFQMRHGLSKKRYGMPKKHDPKKWTQEGPKKIYNSIAMSSCYPNKGERFIKAVFPPIIHLPHMCTILISLFD